MFESLGEKLESVFRRLRGHGKLTEKNIEEALREVRLALLEADVNFKVVKDFIDRVKGQALGQEVLMSLTPEQQFIKIVHTELVALLGGERTELDLAAAPPVVLMLVGLNGSGKTTTSGKLARYLKTELKRSPYLVPADTYRPAAIDQLETLGRQLDVPVVADRDGMGVERLAERGIARAREERRNVVIVETAGRLHIDDAMMAELERVFSAVEPDEALLRAAEDANREVRQAGADGPERAGQTKKRPSRAIAGVSAKTSETWRRQPPHLGEWETGRGRAIPSPT